MAKPRYAFKFTFDLQDTENFLGILNAHISNIYSQILECMSSKKISQRDWLQRHQQYIKRMEATIIKGMRKIPTDLGAPPFELPTLCKEGRVKVLPLERWMHLYMDTEDAHHLPNLTPIAPVFGVPNFYLVTLRNTKVAWFEVSNTQAYLYDVGMFLFTVRALEAERYNHNEIAALKAIQEQNLATKEQNRLLYFINHVQEIRRMRLQGKALLYASKREGVHHQEE